MMGEKKMMRNANNDLKNAVGIQKVKFIYVTPSKKSTI